MHVEKEILSERISREKSTLHLLFLISFQMYTYVCLHIFSIMLYILYYLTHLYIYTFMHMHIYKVNLHCFAPIFCKLFWIFFFFH